MTETMKPKVAGRDREALAKLRSLLDAAVAHLRPLGRLVAIGLCPSKFNDAWYDENWRGIRVGAFFAQRTEYLGATPEMFEKAMAEGPPEARAAREVLETLEARRWRQLFDKAFFETKFDQVLAVLVQDGEARLIASHSNGDGEEGVYLLAGDGSVRYEGICARFDQCLDQEQPLQLVASRAWIWNEQSLEALRPILQQALDGLVRLDAALVAIASCPRRFNGRSYDADWRAAQVGDVSWDSNQGRDVAIPEQVEPALAALERLEHAGWRRLFAEAYGEIAPQQALLLLLWPRGDAEILLCSTEENPDQVDAAYRVGGGGVAYRTAEYMASIGRYFSAEERGTRRAVASFSYVRMPENVQRELAALGVSKYELNETRALIYEAGWPATTIPGLLPYWREEREFKIIPHTLPRPATGPG